MQDDEGYIVYGLRANDGEIRYVGRRKLGYDRLRQHINQAIRYGKTPCHRWIISVLNAGDMVEEIVLEENLSLEESYESERKHIETMGRVHLNTGPLVNVTCGGQGCIGRGHSEETRKRLSKALQGNTNGRHTKGKRLGRSNAAEMPVYAYGPDGEMVATFVSQKSAARHYGISQSVIWKSINQCKTQKSTHQSRSILTASGYLRFKNHSGERIEPMRVLEVMKDGITHRHYMTKRLAADDLNVRITVISGSLRTGYNFKSSSGLLSARWVPCETDMLKEMTK